MTAARRQTAPRVKRVVAPTDFSPGAESALQWGASLSAAFGAELVILNVLDLSLVSVAGLPTEFAAMPAAAELMGRLRAETKTEMAKIAARYPKATTLVREGIPRTGILDVAREGGGDLIVMGTPGRTGLAGLLVGRGAGDGVRHSRIPLLTVRQEEG